MSEYLQEWDALKKLWYQFLFALVVQASIIVASIHYADAIRGNLAPWLALDAVWTLLFIVTAIRLQKFQCPRCGEKFFSSGYYHNVFSRRCLNCGLPKFSN